MGDTCHKQVVLRKQTSSIIVYLNNLYIESWEGAQVIFDKIAIVTLSTSRRIPFFQRGGGWLGRTVFFFLSLLRQDYGKVLFLIHSNIMNTT